MSTLTTIDLFEARRTAFDNLRTAWEAEAKAKRDAAIAAGRPIMLRACITYDDGNADGSGDLWAEHGYDLKALQTILHLRCLEIAPEDAWVAPGEYVPVGNSCGEVYVNGVQYEAFITEIVPAC
jgi:hypothetical protein